MLDVVPVGIGSPLPDLAEAADLTIAQATRAVAELQRQRLVIKSSRLTGHGTVDLYSRRPT